MILLPVHILAGSLGIVTGFVALYATKGSPVHRRVGTAFVASMLVMTMTGIVIAVVRGAGPTLNVPAGLITAYLVVTGYTTLRPARWRPLPWVALGVAFVVGGTANAFGLIALANGGRFAHLPAFAYFMFGVMGIAGGVGDLRMLRAKAPLRGPARINRHLWRMSLALFVAAMSFFIGQAKVIPPPIRIVPLLALPPLTVLATLLYWVWRVRLRRRLAGLRLGTVPLP